MNSLLPRFLVVLGLLASSDAALGSNYKIDLPKSARPWERAAADDLKTYLDLRLGANALSALSDDVFVTSTSPIGSMRGALGASVGPSVPEGTIPVSKTELEAAGAATLTIVDGTAYVGVSVRTNGDLTAKTKSWGKVKFDKDVRVDVSEDGTELVIPVPANAEKGFMVLESGEATRQ